MQTLVDLKYEIKFVSHVWEISHGNGRTLQNVMENPRMVEFFGMLWEW